MGNTVLFAPSFKKNVRGITREEVRALIYRYYTGEPARFVLTGSNIEPELTRGGRLIMTRGQHRYIPLVKIHWINICHENIAKDVANFISCGGNHTPPRDLNHGLRLTLLHEIQHCNQVHERGSDREFWNFDAEYDFRPHEVDARDFVDRHYLDVIRD